VPLRKTDVGLGPEIDPLTDNDAAGVRIADGKTVTEVWLNLMADGQRMHRNSNNVIDGWDTDAYLLALTRPVGADANDPDSVTRCFVACGSYLRKNGKVMLHSLSKVDAVFTCGAPDVKIALHGQPMTRASLRAAAKPHSVNLNGQPIDPAYNAENKIITIRSTTPR
jgi:oligo-alginate lyase